MATTPLTEIVNSVLKFHKRGPRVSPGLRWSSVYIIVVIYIKYSNHISVYGIPH